MLLHFIQTFRLWFVSFFGESSRLMWLNYKFKNFRKISLSLHWRKKIFHEVHDGLVKCFLDDTYYFNIQEKSNFNILHEWKHCKTTLYNNMKEIFDKTSRTSWKTTKNCPGKKQKKIVLPWCKGNEIFPKFLNLKNSHINLQDSPKKFSNDRRNKINL